MILFLDSRTIVAIVYLTNHENRVGCAHTSECSRRFVVTEHYLMFSAGINQQILGNMVSYLTDLKISGATKLTIAMSSPGGNVVCGMTMHNAIASMPYEIITHNIEN